MIAPHTLLEYRSVYEISTLLLLLLLLTRCRQCFSSSWIVLGYVICDMEWMDGIDRIDTLGA